MNSGTCKRSTEAMSFCFASAKVSSQFDRFSGLEKAIVICELLRETKFRFQSPVIVTSQQLTLRQTTALRCLMANRLTAARQAVSGHLPVNHELNPQGSDVGTAGLTLSQGSAGACRYLQRGARSPALADECFHL